MTATQTRTIDVTLTISVPPSGQPTVVVAQPSPVAAEAASAKVKAVVCDKELHRVNLEGFLRSQVGRFVGLDFVKLDGSARTLTGRLGVQKHLKGGTNNVMASDRPYLTVYDMQAKGYRVVNLATVNMVRAQNTRFHVIG